MNDYPLTEYFPTFSPNLVILISEMVQKLMKDFGMHLNGVGVKKRDIYRTYYSLGFLYLPGTLSISDFRYINVQLFTSFVPIKIGF